MDHPLVRKLIEIALEEDAPAGDITSSATIPEGHRSKALIVAKEELLLCGVEVIQKTVEIGAGARCNIKILATDGTWLKVGDKIAELSGDTITLLRLERVMLNFLQHLSGIATHTNRIVEKAKPILVLDTRKTTPGHRILEKYATKIGGARNHRFSLSDMVLIKNNHIDAAGKNISQIINEARQSNKTILVECEVRDIRELREAIKGVPDIIMLDNFNDQMIGEALKILELELPHCQVEVSGGINEERLTVLKKLGVPMISLSALVTKARWVDISMRLYNEV